MLRSGGTLSNNYGISELQLETYFNSESGQFPFERVYTGMDTGQFHDWFAHGHEFTLECISTYLLKSLHMYDCPYANVASSIINLYSASSSNVWKDEALQEFAVTLKKPLVNVCDGINYDEHHRHICRAILGEDLIFLKVLVRYGVLRPDKPGTYNDLEYHFDLLSSYIEWIAVRRPETERLATNHGNQILDRLYSFYWETESNPEGRRKLLRKQTVIKVLPMMSQECNTECIKLYLDTIAENFVSLREIEELIDIPQHLSYVFDERHIEEGYERLRSVFPDCDILQPRSLQQLSRCAVRTHLTERGVLPEVVRKLRLPNDIKQFILISKNGSQ